MTEQSAGIFERECFDIDNLCFEARGGYCRLALLDIFRSRSDQQHVHQLRVLLIRTNHFVVEADLFHRKRNVLVGLDLDLAFEVPLGKTRRHLDDFGNRGVTTNGDRNIGGLGPCAFDGAANGFTDGLGVNDRFFIH